ncbi:DUF2855 family protein [Altererythrobacter arenosus]|uniref:DUF2855 family protein n=1 Tax=Altererythrobacter arenosus TaxID=3032592 RepID=A0ABY8FSF4_9SPHN|nr:DUF2855 family protein [Altererythrobacter sp. CAU 1644]WFL76818.1 DUF2855 family protein [Altererythrobacter sp. CAU 1644]
MTTQVHVARNQLDQAELAEVDAGPLADGAVRLAVESFSVTSNNVTYAVVGEMVGYWNFFPAPEGQGIVPMWGHAKVIESNCPDIEVGERVYGYLPMASHLDVVPGKVSTHGFVDMTAHRQPLPPIYNQYSRLAADPEHDPAREAERMIYGPLFKTGYMIDYFMRSNDWFGAERVILTSASSKTAMGLASSARQNSPEVRRIGLTSAGNVEFVKGTGLYDDVLAYGDVESLDRLPSVSVDFSGNGGLLAQIHQHLGDSLKYSCLVGVTHIDDRRGPAGSAQDLPGPTPTLFFAPDHIVAFFKEYGPQKAAEMMASAWQDFLRTVEGSVQIERNAGLEAARDVFVEMVGGTVDPARGIVIEP